MSSILTETLSGIFPIHFISRSWTTRGIFLAGLPARFSSCNLVQERYRFFPLDDGFRVDVTTILPAGVTRTFLGRTVPSGVM